LQVGDSQLDSGDFVVAAQCTLGLAVSKCLKYLLLAILLVGLLVIHCWNVDELGLNDIRTYSSDVEDVCIPRPNSC